MLVIGELNNQPFFVFFVEVVLIRRVLEHSFPTVIVEIRQVVCGCKNGGKPIVEEDMKLWSNVAHLRIEDKGNGASVLV